MSLFCSLVSRALSWKMGAVDLIPLHLRRKLNLGLSLTGKMLKPLDCYIKSR